MRRRVAVTGAGILCALGDGCDAVWKSLLAGTCGVRPLTRFPAGDMRSPLCAEVVPFEEPGCEGVGFADTMALHAAREAVAGAGMVSLPPGSGVAVGSTRLSRLSNCASTFFFSFFSFIGMCALCKKRPAVVRDFPPPRKPIRNERPGASALRRRAASG